MNETHNPRMADAVMLGGMSPNKILDLIARDLRSNDAMICRTYAMSRLQRSGGCPWPNLVGYAEKSGDGAVIRWELDRSQIHAYAANDVVEATVREWLVEEHGFQITDAPGPQEEVMTTYYAPPTGHTTVCRIEAISLALSE